MTIRRYQLSDEGSVVRLWERCGLIRPWNDPRKDIARKLSEQPELFLVGEIESQLIASVMAGFDGHRGWVYYLAVAPEHQKKSFGRQLMQEVEQLLVARGCPKVNLLVRAANSEVMAFYRSLGYVQDEAISLGRRLIKD